MDSRLLKNFFKNKGYYKAEVLTTKVVYEKGEGFLLTYNINAGKRFKVKQISLSIDEGLNKIFMDAGFEFRQPGCSACLAMNEDKIPKENYCVSTSNRNFEGRQGPGSRTFLASPVTAAISALNGCVSDIREHI